MILILIVYKGHIIAVPSYLFLRYVIGHGATFLGVL